VPSEAIDKFLLLCVRVAALPFGYCYLETHTYTYTTCCCLQDMGRRILTHTKARPKVDRVHTHTEKQTHTHKKYRRRLFFIIIIIRHFYDNRSTLIDVYGI